MFFKLSFPGNTCMCLLAWNVSLRDFRENQNFSAAHITSLFDVELYILLRNISPTSYPFYTTVCSRKIVSQFSHHHFKITTCEFSPLSMCSSQRSRRFDLIFLNSIFFNLFFFFSLWNFTFICCNSCTSAGDTYPSMKYRSWKWHVSATCQYYHVNMVAF